MTQKALDTASEMMVALLRAGVEKALAKDKDKAPKSQ
jgi:hypothetical protein